MTTKKRKKVTKQRGSKSHGWGSKKKHRGAGSRGGRGQAGLMKHKKSWMVQNDPEHFGRSGFTVPKNKRIRAVNLRDIELIAGKMGLKEVDVSLFGFEKVLSSGKITKPLTVKAKKFVAKAKEKIEAAGGKIIEG